MVMAALPRGRAAGRRIFHLPQDTVARLPLRRRAQTLLGKKRSRGLAALAVGGRIFGRLRSKTFPPLPQRNKFNSFLRRRYKLAH